MDFQPDARWHLSDLGPRELRDRYSVCRANAGSVIVEVDLLQFQTELTPKTMQL